MTCCEKNVELRKRNWLYIGYKKIVIKLDYSMDLNRIQREFKLYLTKKMDFEWVANETTAGEVWNKHEKN